MHVTAEKCLWLSTIETAMGMCLGSLLLHHLIVVLELIYLEQPHIAVKSTFFVTYISPQTKSNARSCVLL